MRLMEAYSGGTSAWRWFLVVGVAALGCGGSQALTPKTEPSRAAEAGTSSGGPQAVPAQGDQAAIGLPNERHPTPNIIAGGQPSRDALERAAAAGVKVDISLRKPDEPGFDDERAAAEAAHIRFVSIPINHAAGLTEDNARKLDEALQSAGGRLIIHCGSGNRVGALMALRAFYVQHKTADEAIAIGKAAGMTSLEAAVRAKLTGAPADAAPGTRGAPPPKGQ